MGNSGQGHEARPGQGIDTSSEAAQEATSKPDSGFVEVDRNLGNSGQNQDNSPETSEEATSDEVEEDDDSEPDSEFIEVDMEQSDSKQDWETGPGQDMDTSAEVEKDDDSDSEFVKV